MNLGFHLKQQSPRVVARTGNKNVRYCTSGNKSQVGYINAIGQAMLPFIIYDTKNRMDEGRGFRHK